MEATHESVAEVENRFGKLETGKVKGYRKRKKCQGSKYQR